MAIDWKNYAVNGFYDELINSENKPRPAALELCQYLDSLKDVELQESKNAAELTILVMGITFTVYGEGSTIDRAWPFDIIPRVIPKKEWDRTDAGLKQIGRAHV